jgi:hypothetical protein
VDVTWLKRLVISTHSAAIHGNGDNEEKEEDEKNENDENPAAPAANGHSGRILYKT